jgi:hypothetical protein
MVSLKDAEIERLVKEPKRAAVYRRPLPGMKEKRGHLERDLDLKGTEGSKFRLIIRQNLRNPADFSIILGLIRPGSRSLFHLRRYNGNSHEHTNKIEKDSFLDFHIHIATNRYRDLTGADEDGFAVPTPRYKDLRGAFHCMLEDCGLMIPAELEQELVGEVR